MAYLGTKELRDFLPKCIEGFNPQRIDNVAYELTLGNEVYVTDSKTGKKEILDEKNTQVEIKPGQLALLLTEETVKIPNDILAFISIKFSQKIKGLVNISGFHVDPGFHGKIIFSVYNAGPAIIMLDKGKPYFLMWFSKLTSDSSPYDGKHKNQKEITADHISALKGELASPNVLLERMKNLESTFTNVKWALGIVITLGIGLFIKVIWDETRYNAGYEFGRKEATAKQQLDSVINQIKIDSIAQAKIDSILRLRRVGMDSVKRRK